MKIFRIFLLVIFFWCGSVFVTSFQKKDTHIIGTMETLVVKHTFI